WASAITGMPASVVVPSSTAAILDALRRLALRTKLNPIIGTAIPYLLDSHQIPKPGQPARHVADNRSPLPDGSQPIKQAIRKTCDRESVLHRLAAEDRQRRQVVDRDEQHQGEHECQARAE